MQDRTDLSSELADNSSLTDQQASAYVYRDMLRYSRQDAAARGGIAVNTLDEHLRRARDKVSDVFDLLRLMAIHDLIPVRRSNRKIWHRIDALGCDAAWEVLPNAAYAERIVPAEELENLSGSLCESCFPNRPE